MKKTICKKEYDTEKSTPIKRVTCGSFGDSEGYEEILYQTEGGSYFLYVNGGKDSKYKKEDIKRLSEKAKDAWLSEN